MKSLFDGLNVAYGEIEKRPYLLRTLIAYAATLSTVAFLVAVTAMTVAAPIFLHALRPALICGYGGRRCAGWSSI